MQKISFTLFFFLISTFTYAQDSILEKKLSIHYSNTELRVILKAISQDYNLNFAYSDKQVNLTQRLTIDIDSQSIHQAFELLFLQNGIQYKLAGDQIVLVPFKKRSQITLSGYVREKDSKELLVGANIYIPSLQLGTSTNKYGFYSFTVPLTNDSTFICYSLVGYEDNCNKIYLVADQQEEINLTPLVLQEVVVFSNKEEKASEMIQMSRFDLPVQKVKDIPALMGEKDVMKVIQLLPGVQRGIEGTTGLFVRGGGSDQNLVILDDAVVYNVNHLFGFMSVFNGDAIKSIEFTKGGFPAQYGGRLSSVLELTMKDGDKNKFHGEGSIGLISSHASIQGPLKKEKSSFIVSTRRTYVDLLIKPFLKKDSKVGYYFYDLNAKVNYDFGFRNKIYLSGYFGKDFLNSYHRFEEEGHVQSKLGWGNATGTLRWNHLFSDRVFSNASLIFTNYHFLMSSDYVRNQGDSLVQTLANYQSKMQDISIKYDVDYFVSAHHQMKIGLVSTYHRFKPEAVITKDDVLRIDENSFTSTDAIENALYIKDHFYITKQFQAELGVRGSHFYTQSKTYSFLEPRVLLAYQLSNSLAIKSSYAYMNQFVHLLSSGGVGIPIDLWVPSTPRVRPQASQQIALGIAKDFLNTGLTFTVEGYYKNMDNIISYKEGASFLSVVDYSSNLLNVSKLKPINWEDIVTQGKGWAYGTEFLLEKKEGRLTGWASYTLAWAKVNFKEINFGETYYPAQDRRHTASLVAIYQWKKNIRLSATWTFSSGNPIVIPLSEQISTSNVVNISAGNASIADVQEKETQTIDFSKRGSFRSESYHRLDLGIQFQKKKKWGERTWEISFYNAYSRLNPFYYFTSYDKNQQRLLLKKYAIFPIIPSVSYSFKF